MSLRQAKHVPGETANARECLAVNDKDAVLRDRELPGFGLRVYLRAPGSMSFRLATSARRSASPWDNAGMSHRTRHTRKPLASSPASRTERRPFPVAPRATPTMTEPASAISANMSRRAAGRRP